MNAAAGIDCTFARAELAAALGRLAGVLPQRTTLPVLETCRITWLESGERVRIEATDASRHAEVTLSLAEPSAEFPPFCVSLSTLLGAAGAFPGVVATLTGEQNAVVFAAAASKVKMPTIPADEFPNLRFNETAFVDAGGGDAATLRLALSRVAYAMCAAVSNPALKGVFVSANGKRLVAVACDRHCLSKEYAEGWDIAEMAPATIPAFGVTSLCSFFPGGGHLSLRAGETRLRFTNEAGDTLTLPTLDDPYPNVEQIIPRDSDIEIRVDRAALFSAAKRVGLVLRNVGIGRVVTTVGSGHITFLAKSEIGTAEESVPAEISGDTLRIGFNVRFLIDTLSSLSGETVVAEMKAPERATIWREPNGHGMRLIMPLRLL